MDYKNRKGEIIHEDNSQDKMLHGLYSSIGGRMLLHMMSSPTISKLAGAYMDSWMSTFLIDPFVKKHEIRMKDFERKQYHSYNQFFTRKLKRNRRPVESEQSRLISPCDGRISVYPIRLNSVFEIKGSTYSVASLLKNKKLAREYAGGYCAIVRLTVEDYHRYCYVDNGTKGRNHFIQGRLYTVHPAILGKVDIYKENSREYCVLETDNFGKVVQVEVGALLVGRINNYHKEAVVYRGQEKGRFEFGGSTIVLLFQRDQVAFDDQFLKNTKEGFETKVQMGEGIGSAMF